MLFSRVDLIAVFSNPLCGIVLPGHDRDGIMAGLFFGRKKMTIRRNKRGFWERKPKYDTLKIVLLTLIIANGWLLIQILKAVGF